MVWHRFFGVFVAAEHMFVLGFGVGSESATLRVLHGAGRRCLPLFRVNRTRGIRQNRTALSMHGTFWAQTLPRRAARTIGRSRSIVGNMFRRASWTSFGRSTKAGEVPSEGRLARGARTETVLQTSCCGYGQCGPCCRPSEVLPCEFGVLER
ncbi:hypothetical protein DENSPDRAFT_331822 [Dentipellis sp. KUC8613]|nr:hypothetical protein DENSPDRAFT_331822 [Dentipellis sp. KUC8613]